MATNIACNITHTVQPGESLYKIIRNECPGIKPNDAKRLALEWNRTESYFDKNVYDLNEWSWFSKKNNPALSRLPVAEVKERILAKVAKALDREEAPKDLQFVNIDPGEVINAKFARDESARLYVYTYDLEKRDKMLTQAQNQNVHTPSKTGTGIAVIYGSDFWHGGCFSGATYLMLADGSPITFEEYAKRFNEENNEELAVASYDTETGEVVFQSPANVLVHEGDFTLANLEMTTPYGVPLGNPLEVTYDHRLLTNASNDGWTAVGDLSAGEHLIGIIGGMDYFFNIAPSDNNTYTNVVYNLSCSTPDAVNEARSNFLVSPDGINWIPAHNIKQYE